MIEAILYISGGLLGLLVVWLLDRIHSRLSTIVSMLHWFARYR